MRRFVVGFRGFVGFWSLIACLPAQAEQVSTGQATRLVKPEPEMAFVGGGDFQMGLTDGQLDDFHQACRDTYAPDGIELCEQQLGFDSPEREVYVSSFFMDRFEVTVTQYRACVEAGACDLGPLVVGDVRFIVDAWPIVNVTHDDAETFCKWRGKRLPTEAEWEKAARGDDGRAFPWGNSDPGFRSNHGKAVQEGMHPIDGDPANGTTDDSDDVKLIARPGTYPMGASPYGVYDMAGNVGEWVADWYAPKSYTAGDAIDPTGPAIGTHRVIRGGSFNEPALWTRTYARMANLPQSRLPDVGFRCARDVSP